MPNRATDLLVLMLLAACGGAGHSTATAEAADSPAAVARPMVESTTYLGPFAGEGAALHPDNVKPQPIAFYGTDLGFTYQHGEQLQILFGDSWATERYAPIEASTGSRFDDGFGTIDVRKGFDPASITPTSIPPIRLGQNPGTTEMSAIDPGHAMDLGKTPMAGFSNGTREFGVFNIGKPQGCTKDAERSNGLTCDTTLGYFGSPYWQRENGTVGCRDGTPGCTSDTMVDAANKPVPSSGLCTDPTSPLRNGPVSNLLSSIGIRVLIGARDKATPKDRKSTRLNSSHGYISYAVFCLKKKKSTNVFANEI